MTEPTSLHLYRVYAQPGTEGGKLIALHPGAERLDDLEMQAMAATSGAPVSMFVTDLNDSGISLRAFTPEREKGESDSGALAALAWLFGQGRIADVSSVWMKGQEFPAQLCGGEWMLRQGDATAEVLATTPSADALAYAVGLTPDQLDTALPVLIASAGRPNLLLAVQDGEALDAIHPDREAIAALGHATGTTGLLAYTTRAARGLHADFRYFAPLKGFLEDNASSNTYASLVAGLSLLGHVSAQDTLIRASQGRATGRPSRLSAQADLNGATARSVWVGGPAEPLRTPRP
ncbi:PhzF family phenazine biosynthesis isomerase [Deinococcus sonorensis]|uniref:PhzF family phenazine biosynthesis isomerase n=2 Tax=Deinococcus sonorensis TaxID=309891 RepID=A0AAU7U9C7_9DEIO